ncbi:MAG: transcriptional repressor LexA [Spirochaetales bacterium]|nr:transcriptional repressor LexA [Spirochaetales bacterium]
MKGLTERQQEIAQFIEKYFDENGYAPSLRDIGNNFGFSPKAAYDHLRALEKKNIIKTADNLPRGMALLKRTTPESGTVIKVPILGTTAAGAPIHSEPVYDGFLSVPQDLVGCGDSDQLYALRVRGDSMIDDGINDGDMAIIRKTKWAENGEIVAASIGDDENYGITLKHFYHVGDRYELHPANQAYKVIVSTHCEIHGKLLMIIRQYGR